MATKSFLFLAAFLSLASACDTLQTRKHAPQPLPVKVEPGQPQPVPQTPTQGAPNGTEAGMPVVPVQETVPHSGQVLPVGVYLSAGAIRSFAHIGVLRVLQRAQVPIVAIGGMEWGSIVAASYATSRGANEVEWEMMKLRKEELPSTSLLGHEVTARDTQELFGFLKNAFGDKDLAGGTVPFRCSTTDGDETQFISTGKAREQLLKCSVLPPMYRFYDRAGKQWVSGAVSPGDWPGELRKAGAQYIIYVDVVSHGNVLSLNKYPNEQQLRALWMAVKSISKEQHLFANLTMEIPMDIDLTDFDRRRDAVAVGERVANTYINDILHAIGIQ